MSQQIQGYGNNPYAEEALRLAEIGRGQQGMARTTAPVGPNLQDSGGMSKPSVNAQPFNERLLMQNMSENAKTVPQAQPVPSVLSVLLLPKSPVKQKAKSLLLPVWLRCFTPTMQVPLLLHWLLLKLPIKLLLMLQPKRLWQAE